MNPEPLKRKLIRIDGYKHQIPLNNKELYFPKDAVQSAVKWLKAAIFCINLPNHTEGILKIIDKAFEDVTKEEND